MVTWNSPQSHWTRVLSDHIDRWINCLVNNVQSRLTQNESNNQDSGNNGVEDGNPLFEGEGGGPWPDLDVDS